MTDICQACGNAKVGPENSCAACRRTGQANLALDKASERLAPPWWPIVSLTLALIALLAFEGGPEGDIEADLGVAMAAVAGLIIGVICLHAGRRSGRALSIAGIVMSCVVLFALLGTLA